jgi:hypothetical protein
MQARCTAQYTQYIDAMLQCGIVYRLLYFNKKCGLR